MSEHRSYSAAYRAVNGYRAVKDKASIYRIEAKDAPRERNEWKYWFCFCAGVVFAVAIQTGLAAVLG